MASTNKTTNYDLSQYVGSDKPSYLNDYNQDMSKIDLGIHAAKSEADTNATAIGNLSNLTTTATTDLVSAINEVDSTASTANATAVQADGKATTNATAIGTLANLSTTNKTDLVSATNEVNGKVGNLANLDTTEKGSTVGAINEVNYNVSLFNLTSFNNYTNTSDIVITGAVAGSVTCSKLDVSVAKNSNGSLAKIYGRMTINTNGNQGGANVYTCTLNVDTGLRPSTDITIKALGIRHPNVDNGIYPADITIKTDGKIELLNFTSGGSQVHTLVFSPCLIFVKDFGDTPTPE